MLVVTGEQIAPTVGAAAVDNGSVVRLSSLPFELIFEIATYTPIQVFRCVMRFDTRLVACTKLQRWYRRCRKAPGGDMISHLNVGDRVLVWGTASVRRVQYATAAARLSGAEQPWKIRLMSEEYVNVPGRYIRRLEAWANGPWAGSVGRTAALASASRARGAATHANAAAVVAMMRSGVDDAEAALAIAAATAASAAAAAATAASSAVAPAAANDLHAQEAGDLLRAAQQAHQVQHTFLAKQEGAIQRPLVPSQEETTTSVVAQAARAAAEAAAEARAAASAAEAAAAAATVHAATGALAVTATTAATVALAAEQVVTALTAIAGSPACATSTTRALAAETAAEVLADAGAAGLALSSAPAPAGHNAAHAAAQAAAQVAAQAAAQAAAQVRDRGCMRLAAGSERVEAGGAQLELTPHEHEPAPTTLSVPMPTLEAVTAFLQHANPSAHGPPPACTGPPATAPLATAPPGPSAQQQRRRRQQQRQRQPPPRQAQAQTSAQVEALDDAVHGIFEAMKPAAAPSRSTAEGLLPAIDCPLLFGEEDPRNVWALEGRFRAATRTVSLPFAGLTATI